jgi:hypothetical protein
VIEQQHLLEAPAEKVIAEISWGSVRESWNQRMLCQSGFVHQRRIVPSSFTSRPLELLIEAP